MASDWFVNLSKADIKYLSKEQENVNTKKKLNLNGFKLFMEFLTSDDERRELQETPAAKLQKFATKFLLGVRCQQGFYWHLHLLEVYIFTAHFKIQKLIFVGYMMYSWIVLAARFTFWHKLYVNFKLNSNLIVYIINRGYYTAARRYELYFRVVKNNILLTCCARS